MLKAAARAVKNYAKGYSDTQAKVHEATSTDSWGPSTTQMHEIAQLTHKQGDFIDVMETLEKVLNYKGKDWHRVFKGLVLLDYLLRHGSEDVVFYYSAGTTNRDTINTLRYFQYIDDDGKDEGSMVRQKAKGITNLLLDEGRLCTERTKVRAQANPSARNRITNGTAANGYPDEKSASSSKRATDPSLPQEQRPEPTNNADDDDDELRRAIDLSMQEQHERPEDVDLRIALERSLFQSPLQRARDDSERPGAPSPPPYTEKYDDRDLRRAIELSQEQPEDVDLRRAIEASLLTNEGRGGGVVRPRPPTYATHYTRGMHDAPPPAGSEKHVSVDSSDDRDLRRAIELSLEQPEDVDLRRAIEASLLTSESRGGGVLLPRPPSYATHYARGMHDAPAPTGSEKHVSADLFEELLMERHAPEPVINGASEHGDSMERDLLDLYEDDGSGQDSGAQHREIEPKDSPSLPGLTQISPSTPSIGSSPQFPPFQPAVVQVFQQTSVSPGIPFSLPENRSPIREVDPDIRSGSSEGSSLEDRLNKSGSSSGSHSVTPSTSPEPLVVTVPTSPRPLPQLPSQRPQEWTAERTDAHDERQPVDRTLSVTESESNVSTESSEGPPSWQTEAYIDSLLASWERRRPLLSMVMLPDADRRGLSAAQVRQRLGDVEAQIRALLIHIIDSREARHAAQRLESDRAQSFMDAIQDALDRGTLPDSHSRSKARRLMQKVSEAGEQLPTSLFIEGVNDHDEHPTFGGGFGDVYQASYQGKLVALKRIRTFTADSTTHRNRLQFYKEALVWQGLRHRFILPLLGIDRSTFAPSFCMVSPWMKHGTVLKYLRDHGREQVNRLLLEIAQGLDYLHSMNVVHGDLRGTNILISDDGSACLSDFGLATTIADADSTIGVTSSSNRAGSVRWFAPELIEPTNFGCKKFIRTKASDVYAYACVCIELYTGNPPFSDLQDVAAMLRVIRGERPEQPPSISTAVWQLVTSAWVEDFRGRPTIHDIAVALEGIP